jgi:XTP/dITP diphosphohydrolase
MKLDSLCIATSNQNKIREIRRMFNKFGVTVSGLPLGSEMPEETGSDFRENARIKALFGYELTGLNTLADDSGLEVEALNGAPGVHSARWADGGGDEANNKKLLLALRGIENRRARFRCSMILIMNDMIIEADGSCDGEILESPRGSGGFGYDPLFWIPELGKTTAELTEEEKNRISHRGRALENLVAKLYARRLL